MLQHFNAGDQIVMALDVRRNRSQSAIGLHIAPHVFNGIRRDVDPPSLHSQAPERLHQKSARTACVQDTAGLDGFDQVGRRLAKELRPPWLRSVVWYRTTTV